VTCPNFSDNAQVPEPSIGDALDKNGTVNNQSVEIIVGDQLVRELIQNHTFSKVEKFQPWALDDATEQEAIQQEKKQQIKQITAFQRTLPKKRRRTNWDKELDKGRVKKVRTKKVQGPHSVNRFQHLAKQKM